MNVLALDCSNKTPNVCWSMEGEEVYCSFEGSKSGALPFHIREFLKKIGKEPNEIEHLAIHVGPGSATGLRMAVALAQSWAMVIPKLNIYAIPLEALVLEMEGLKDQWTKEHCFVSDAQAGQCFVFEPFAQQNIQILDWKEFLSDEQKKMVICDLQLKEKKGPWPENWTCWGGALPNARECARACLRSPEKWLEKIESLDVRYLKASSAEIQMGKK